jgi:hypothetical protein
LNFEAFLIQLSFFTGGPADLAGLRVGDKVLSVNGISVINVDHYDAVEVLKACGRVLILVIIREVTRIMPPSEQVNPSLLFYSATFFRLPVCLSLCSALYVCVCVRVCVCVCACWFFFCFVLLLCCYCCYLYFFSPFNR